MRLKSIQFTEWEGIPTEWVLEPVTLQAINLVVGINASGKTRALNLINNLARLISGKQKMTFASGHYRAIFDSNGSSTEYILRYQDKKIIEEVFTQDGTELLRRGEGGIGRIFAQKQQVNLDFQTDDSELAVVARKDSIQHKFFEPIHQWASSAYFYSFGTPLGKQSYAVLLNDAERAKSFDPADQENAVGVWLDGNKKFGEKFKESIIRDMASLDYAIDNIDAAAPTGIKFDAPAPVVGMILKEHDLGGNTEQHIMSQGMFRAFSLLMRLNHLQMSGGTGTVIIDDIGEGLDFSRSCSLIEVVMKKAIESGFQLIMSTNDRFVMNKVPLSNWTLLKRSAIATKVFNYTNSKDWFDEFKFTGLNNFDFLAMDFAQGDTLTGTEDALHEEASHLR